MSEMPTPTNGDVAGEATNARKEEFARMLERKREQGYEIESQSDTRAVLRMKGHRRRFGRAGEDIRTEVSIDEFDQGTSRRI